jgi:hypothetical protein
VDGLTAARISNESKAFAQLHLGTVDPANFIAAEHYFADQTIKYPGRSLYHYNLACLFAVRSISHAADKDARTKDVSAAIESLRKGVMLANYPLRKFLNTTSDLAALEEDSRFQALLSEEDAHHEPGSANPE